MFTIKVINVFSFKIGDTRNFSKYIRNGTCKNIKLPVDYTFKPFASCELTKQTNIADIPFDQNVLAYDFLKLNNPKILHVFYNTL